MYVRLWYKEGSGLWQYNDYTYTLDCSGCTQEIISPTPGTQICNTSETFCWNECPDTTYWLGVGTSQASVANSPYGDIFAGSVTGGCQIVNNIPSTGTLYVRLWYKEGSGSWEHNDYTYTLDCGACTDNFEPNDTSSQAYGPLTSGDSYNAKICSATDEDWYEIEVGSAGNIDLGLVRPKYSYDIELYDSNNVRLTPTGRFDLVGNNYVGHEYSASSGTYFIRIFGFSGAFDESETYELSGIWPSGTPEITSPAPNFKLNCGDVTFTWSANSTAVDKWWLYVGTTQGGKDILDSGALGSSTSTTVSGIPEDGSMVYVRLWYKVGSDPWLKVDFQYTAASNCGVCGFDEQFNSGNAENWNRDSGFWNVVSDGWYQTNVVHYASSTSTYYDTYSGLDYSARLDGAEIRNSNRILVRVNGATMSNGIPTNTYLFQITWDSLDGGVYSIWKVVDGVDSSIQSWAQSSAINNGTGNLLRVVANGPSIQFYINGTLVWSGQDSSLSSGRVGIGFEGYGLIRRVYWATLVCLQASYSFSSNEVSNEVGVEQQLINDAANANPVGNIHGVHDSGR